MKKTSASFSHGSFSFYNPISLSTLEHLAHTVGCFSSFPTLGKCFQHLSHFSRVEIFTSTLSSSSSLFSTFIVETMQKSASSFSISTSVSYASPFAYTVTSASKECPISFNLRFSSNALVISPLSARRLFHFSSSFSSRYSGFASGQFSRCTPVSYTHLTLPTTPYV